MPIWIPITITAALFQSWRTAMQQKLRGLFSVNGAAFIRFLYGAPVALVYLGAALAITHTVPRAPGPVLLALAAAGGLTQIIGTNLLIMAFGFRNFAVGSAYSKTEAMQTGLIALVVLHEQLAPLAWGGIGVGLAGVLTLSLGVRGLRHRRQINASARRQRCRSKQRLRTRSTPLIEQVIVERVLRGREILAATMQPAALCGLGAGFFLGTTGVFIKLATHHVAAGSLAVRALYVLAAMTLIQIVMQGTFLAWRDPAELVKSFREWRRAGWVGLLSASGSACWFAGFALTDVALVRALGQIEVVFTLGFSRFYLGEKLKRAEIGGILLVVVGVLMVVVSGV